MKTLSNIVGAAFVAAGAAGLLDGFGVIHLGFMSGRRRWILAGAVLLVAGILVFIVTNRRKAAT